jgi:hypothetical protein
MFKGFLIKCGKVALMVIVLISLSSYDSWGIREVWAQVCLLLVWGPQVQRCDTAAGRAEVRVPRPYAG